MSKVKGDPIFILEQRFKDAMGYDSWIVRNSDLALSLHDTWETKALLAIAKQAAQAL